MRKIDANLIESFILLNEFFQKQQIRYCLIGGIAAGFWGEPRYTQDMDFTVVNQEKNLEVVCEQLKKTGFKVRSKGKSQCQITQKGEQSFQADLILAETNYQDWVVDRALEVDVFNVKTRICSAEDLIILKLIANRRQDLLDIENILQNHFTQLDYSYLKKWFQFWDLTERYQKEFGDQWSF